MISRLSGKTQSEISYGVPHQVFYECDQLCYAKSFTTKAMLEIVLQIILVYVGDHIGSNNMLEHFA